MRVSAIYCGPYGRRHHPAYVSGVGYVYFNQIIEMDAEVFETLPVDEWKAIGACCRHIKLDGTLCEEPPVPNTHLCKFHTEELKQSVQSLVKDDDANTELSPTTRE